MAENKPDFLKKKDYFDKVWISNGAESVIGYLSQEFTASLEQNYENPFNIVNSAIINYALSKTSNLSTVFDMKNVYVWTGSTPFTFALPLVFIAETNIIEDLVKPITNLMRMTSPRVSKQAQKFIAEYTPDGFEKYTESIRPLEPPITKDRKISIRIGDLFELQECVISGIGLTFSPPYIYSKGQRLPSKVDVELSVQSINMMTYEEIGTAFFPKSTV
jgi:hypothetical protein